MHTQCIRTHIRTHIRRYAAYVCTLCSVAAAAAAAAVTVRAATVNDSIANSWLGCTVHFGGTMTLWHPIKTLSDFRLFAFMCVWFLYASVSLTPKYIYALGQCNSEIYSTSSHEPFNHLLHQCLHCVCARVLERRRRRRRWRLKWKKKNSMSRTDDARCIGDCLLLSKKMKNKIFARVHTLSPWTEFTIA